MIFPKKVWTKKGMVFYQKKPVRKLDDKVGIYDPNFTEVDSWEVYPAKGWEDVSPSEPLIIYDWEDPINIGTFEDWLESTYQFVDYDSTVLKSWKVKDWETPTAPTNPSRTWYTFTGWNPTVWPINKNTTFSAVYTINSYTVNFTNDGNGSTNYSSIGRDYWSSITISSNTITIADVTVTATPSQWYEFDTWVNADWGDIPATLTANLNIRATFKPAGYTITFQVSEETYSEWWGTISAQSIQVPVGTTVTVDAHRPSWDWHDPILIFKNDWQTIATVTATPTQWYMFIQWATEPYVWEDETIESDVTFTAYFNASSTVTFVSNPVWGGTFTEQSMSVPTWAEYLRGSYNNDLEFNWWTGDIWWSNAISATPASWYEFSSWSPEQGTILGDTTITANFQAQTYSINATTDDRDNYGHADGYIDNGWGSTTGIPYWTTWSASWSSIVFSNGLTLTPEPWYDSEFEGWYTSWNKSTSTWTVLPETGTVTGNMNIICVFGGMYNISIYPYDGGSANKDYVEVPFGTVVSMSGNTITFEKGWSTIDTVTVTPNTNYRVAYTNPDILNSYKTVGNGGITSNIEIYFTSDVSY